MRITGVDRTARPGLRTDTTGIGVMKTTTSAVTTAVDQSLPAGAAAATLESTTLTPPPDLSAARRTVGAGANLSVGANLTLHVLATALMTLGATTPLRPIRPRPTPPLLGETTTRRSPLCVARFLSPAPSLAALAMSPPTANRVPVRPLDPLTPMRLLSRGAPSRPTSPVACRPTVVPSRRGMLPPAVAPSRRGTFPLAVVRKGHARQAAASAASVCAVALITMSAARACTEARHSPLRSSTRTRMPHPQSTSSPPPAT